jgi:murein DD-endopeptidase MepM/ murein hydrolase activator NlpD
MYGNRVTLDLGLDRYATYGHMQPGLRVKAGDKVRAGQLLGLIGNSGLSGSPHLYFQVTDGPDPIASEGIPLVFTSFSRNGTQYSDEMPMNGWIIAFPERK